MLRKIVDQRLIVARTEQRRADISGKEDLGTTVIDRKVTDGMQKVRGDEFQIIAAAQIDSSGNYAVGDNSNARAIADLQYTSIDISQWTCDRINGNSEGSVTTTIEGYYHTLVSSIGVISESATRSRTFTEAMVNKLTEVRDSISAVSLDEEMANLIQFQHAYAAAAKLISVSDEMLETLISVK